MTQTVLIVEDQLFVVLDLEDLVAGEGYAVSAHCGTVAATLQAIERRPPVCAILDVRLPDGEIFPAADRMRDMNIPLIFHSGHANEAELRARYPEAQICPKPSTPTQLRAALKKAITETV